jgi:hypothetical protein
LGFGGKVMPPRKTIYDYIQSIKEKHEELKKEKTKRNPGYETLKSLKKELDSQLRGWIKNLNITIFVAQNEKLDWKPEELNEFSVRPMLLKSECGYDQVGDYQAYYEGGGVAGWIPILVERKGGRKGCEDLYGTLTNQDHCDTFYREIDRYYADPRFNQMIVITECTLPEFLLYIPPFNGKTRNVNHIGASPESRGGKIDSLFDRGVPVLFAGTRKLAIQRYKGIIKAWLRLNYAFVLKLDVEPYNDLKTLQDKKSRLEVELHAVNGSLERLGDTG